MYSLEVHNKFYLWNLVSFKKNSEDASLTLTMNNLVLGLERLPITYDNTKRMWKHFRLLEQKEAVDLSISDTFATTLDAA